MKIAVLLLATSLVAYVQAMPLGVRIVLWHLRTEQHQSVSDVGVCSMPIALRAVLWRQNAIRLEADAFPDLGVSPSGDLIHEVVAKAADPKLSENLTDAAIYADYRHWAMGLDGISPGDIKRSQFSWISYAFALPVLLSALPGTEDISIDAFNNETVDGVFSFTVKVKDIAVGERALEDNIKKVLGIEGVERLATDVFSSDAVDVKDVAVEDGKVRFSVRPKSGDNGILPESFFFRVKMK